MTDAEKELRRLAQSIVDSGTSPFPEDIRMMQDMLWPKDVLALLDRIEALEKQAAEAERKGAEEMRRAVVIRLRETSLGLDVVGRMTDDYDIKHHLYDRSSGYDEAAEDVALLKSPTGSP